MCVCVCVHIQNTWTTGVISVVYHPLQSSLCLRHQNADDFQLRTCHSPQPLKSLKKKKKKALVIYAVHQRHRFKSLKKDHCAAEGQTSLLLWETAENAIASLGRNPTKRQSKMPVKVELLFSDWGVFYSPDIHWLVQHTARVVGLTLAMGCLLCFPVCLRKNWTLGTRSTLSLMKVYPSVFVPSLPFSLSLSHTHA